jgi:peptidoglycan/LPS O-acetylase OafA/YrhL
MAQIYPPSAENQRMNDRWRLGERIAYVDGLRAVAVLMVIAHHAILHSPLLPRPVPFLSAAHFLLEGSHGVDLFFVLSGFCLSHPLLERLRRGGEGEMDLNRYFAKRLVRIIPPYYAAIVLFLLLPHSANVSDVLKQMFFFDWHTNFLNGSFWTLCVELRWYFVFPIALALWVRAPRIFCALALLTVIAYGFTRLHAPDVGTLLAFMLGIIAADIEVCKPRIDPVVWLALPVFVLLALVLEQSASMPGPSGADSAIFFVQTNVGWQIAAFLLVIAGARWRVLRRCLSFKPLVAVGTASYSIYLVHEPVVTLVQHRLGIGPEQRLLISYAAALAAGFLFWAAFERVWMFGTLKARAISFLERPIAALSRALDVPGRLQFTHEQHGSPEFGIE